LRHRELTECPVCHTLLANHPADCPKCSTPLGEYYALFERANSLVAQAVEAATRHEFARAHELVEELRRVNPLFEPEATVISAKAAVYQHRFEEASQLATRLPTDDQDRLALEEEIVELHRIERDGKEHFNLALSSARKGYWTDAEYHTGKALALIPYLPAPWRLAVKLALSREEWELARERVKHGLAAIPEDTYLRRMAEELPESD